MQRINNTDSSKQNTSGNRTITQNSKNKIVFSPTSIFSKTEVTKKISDLMDSKLLNIIELNLKSSRNLNLTLQQK